MFIKVELVFLLQNNWITMSHGFYGEFDSQEHNRIDFKELFNHSDFTVVKLLNVEHILE